MEEFGEKVPNHLSLSVGYFDNSTKCWLLKSEDLDIMYDTLSKKKDIVLWCDGVVNDDLPEGAGPSTKKSKKEENKEDSKEKDFDCVLKQLQKKHKDQYPVPLLRLWARVCVNGLHESLYDPLGLPQFQSAKKNVCKSSTTLSLSKVAETRSKYIEQLHQIKSLNTEGVLSDKEYDEQKDIILETLRKLK